MSSSTLSIEAISRSESSSKRERDSGSENSSREVEMVFRNQSVSIDIIHLRQTQKLKLAELDSEEMKKIANWACIHSRALRNTIRIGVATSVSAAGAWLAGYLPNDARAIVGGALLSGGGNGLSTFLFFEKKWQHLIIARMIDDLPVIIRKVCALEFQLRQIIRDIERVSGETVLVSETPVTPDPTAPTDSGCCMSSRVACNIFSFAVAGLVSAGGSWLQGFEPTVTGVFFGGLASAGANGLSTWLTNTTLTDVLIKETALITLPQWVDQINADEDAFFNLVDRTTLLFPKVALTELEGTPELEVDEEEEPCCSRGWTNFAYVGIAGTLSTVGSLISSFSPHPPGISVGGGVGGLGNLLSTALVWQSPHDRKLKYLVVKVIPVLAQKIAMIAHYKLQLAAFIEKRELSRKKASAESEGLAV